MMKRTTKEILHDHLEKRQKGEILDDLRINFSPDCVLLSTYGVFRGHEGVIKSNDLLQKQLDDATYEYTQLLISGHVGFLEWKARSAKGFVEDGADSFIITGEKIVVQTIHYTLVKTGGS